MKYKCVEEFSLPCLDEEGNDSGETGYVVAGSLWEKDEEYLYTLCGADFRLNEIGGNIENDFPWIEINIKELEEYFEEVTE